MRASKPGNVVQKIQAGLVRKVLSKNKKTIPQTNIMKTTKSILAAFGILVLVTPLASAQVAFDWATVADINNTNDSTGYGAVSSIYNIATKEVNLFQYRAFLNAVAATDTYSLYNTSMGSNANIAGITRSGSSGSYTYAVSGSGNRPVTYVSWFDAARFSNWVANGQPTGAQGNATTENGAYTLDGATNGVSFTKNGINPNTGATTTYWIPSENEWYKAAYYQPVGSGGPSDSYWLYPTGSDTIPNSSNGSTSDVNSGNFNRNVAPTDGVNDGYAVSGSTSFPTGNALTDGGAFTLADSYYGTFDQGGNVFEWNDAVISGSARGLRGGSWDGGEDDLRASFRYFNFGVGPTFEGSNVGFRVGSVPEPSTAMLMMLGGAAYWLVRRRKATL